MQWDVICCGAQQILPMEFFGDQCVMFLSLGKVWMQARVTLCDYFYKYAT